MPTFVSLLTYTDQGIRKIKDTTKRADTARKLAAKHGCELKAIYYTMGQYDAVSIVEAPDDESYSAFALAIGSLGNVRTLSLRAYSGDDMKRMVSKL